MNKYIEILSVDMSHCAVDVLTFEAAVFFCVYINIICT